ncbi:PLAC8-domain-containing protein [Infundibulicybe gibba]|nr:PLAC8-domain-containing protein [Infundibulicybe gibba]
MPFNQPEPTYDMLIAPGGGNRNAKNLPTDSNGREWSNGLCSCCDEAGTCALALCCSCVLYGRNKQRLNHLNQSGAPHPNGGGLFSSDCCIHAAAVSCGLGWITQCFTRSSVRSRYHIKGGVLSDCCTALFCAPCDLVQEAREIELEEQSLGAGGQVFLH